MDSSRTSQRLARRSPAKAGAKTSGLQFRIPHPGGVAEFWHPSWMRESETFTGGLRCAATPVYSLTSLRLGRVFRLQIRTSYFPGLMCIRGRGKRG